MGNKCCCKRDIKKKIVVLLVGLDNAGKTVAAKGLAGESVESVVPTVGFSVVNLSFLKYIVKVYDLGGGANIRGIWHKYFVDAHGVIFVVDSSDIPRLDEAKQVLQELLSHEKISGKPILVLANKQDNKYALDEIDLIEKLDLESMVNFYKCPTLVESCSATEATGNAKIDPGIKKGYEWLLNYVIRNYAVLNKRIEEDVRQQTITENCTRLEKIERIRLMKDIELRNKLDEDAIESYSNYERKIHEHHQQENSTVNNATTTIISPHNDNDNELSSEDSSDSLPRVYHIKDEVLLERPRSAVQIVKQHLQLNDSSKRSSFVSKASNKTAPLHIYGVRLSRSAGATRRNHFVEERRRYLRSASDRRMLFQRNELPTVVSPFTGNGDEFHKEIFDLRTLDGTQRFASRNKFKRNSEGNGVPWTHKPRNGDVNGISIVDVDL